MAEKEIKTATLYLRVKPDTKRWLQALAKKQVGRISQSTMAEQIFVAARRLGLLDRA